MGIGIAIAITVTAIVATVGADIGFGVEEKKKQKELKDAMSKAQTACTNAQNFYNDIYKVVKSRLEKLQQSMKKLPSDVINKLGDALTLNLSEPQAVQYVGWAISGGALATGIVGGVASYLLTSGAAAADGIVAGIGAVAGAAGAVFAVAGFGLALYSGITELNKLNDAIDTVNDKRQQAEKVIAQMQQALDGLLKSMHLQAGNYQKLKEISDDWDKLSQNFDQYSTAFYYAITGFAKNNNLAQVKELISSRGYVSLKDDVLDLAKIIQEDIFDMIRQGKTDEQIINFYAKENPNDGLRFLLDPFFVDSLRQYLS